MRLIDNWRVCYRFWSLRLAAIGATLASVLLASPEAALWAWNLMPADLKSVIPAQYTPFIGIFIFFMSMVARLVKQDLRKDDGTPKGH